MTVLAAAEAPEAAAAAGEGVTGAQSGLRRAGIRSSGRAPRQPAVTKQARSSRRISRNNYQAVILVEFIAAILLTAMTPVATKKDTQGLSPYAGSDIVKLGAITLVYLILAMISVGGPQAGRLAAWLGGLVLLTDGLYEASNIAKDLQAFTGGGSPDVTQPKAKAA